MFARPAGPNFPCRANYEWLIGQVNTGGTFPREGDSQQPRNESFNTRAETSRLSQAGPGRVFEIKRTPEGDPLYGEILIQWLLANRLRLEFDSSALIAGLRSADPGFPLEYFEDRPYATRSSG